MEQSATSTENQLILSAVLQAMPEDIFFLQILSATCPSPLPCLPALRASYAWRHCCALQMAVVIIIIIIFIIIIIIIII